MSIQDPPWFDMHLHSEMPSPVFPIAHINLLPEPASQSSTGQDFLGQRLDTRQIRCIWVESGSRNCSHLGWQVAWSRERGLAKTLTPDTDPCSIPAKSKVHSWVWGNLNTRQDRSQTEGNKTERRDRKCFSRWELEHKEPGESPGFLIRMARQSWSLSKTGRQR